LQNNVLLLTAGIPTPAERCLGHFTRTSNNFTNSHIGSIDLKKYDKMKKLDAGISVGEDLGSRQKNRGYGLDWFPLTIETRPTMKEAVCNLNGGF